jgi:hypothetical protein
MKIIKDLSKDINTKIFIAVLFIIEKKPKQLKSKGEIVK